MDHSERVRQQHGEFYNPDTEVSDERRKDGRLREIVERLRDEDNRQNHRIQVLEEQMSVMQADVQKLWNHFNRLEVALIGPDGKNGMRKTMQDQYDTTTERLGTVEGTLGELSVKIGDLLTTFKTIMKVFKGLGGVITVAGIVVGIVVAL